MFHTENNTDKVLDNLEKPLWQYRPTRSCLGSDCPERFSLCCKAGCTNGKGKEATYVCFKCRKAFTGGACTAGEKANFLQVGPTIECGACFPDKYPDCETLPINCGCKCHTCPHALKHTVLTTTATQKLKPIIKTYCADCGEVLNSVLIKERE